MIMVVTLSSSRENLLTRPFSSKQSLQIILVYFHEAVTGAVVTGCGTTSGLSETTGSLRISHVEVFTGSIANISLGSVRRAVGTCK